MSGLSVKLFISQWKYCATLNSIGTYSKPHLAEQLDDDLVGGRVGGRAPLLLHNADHALRRVDLPHAHASAKEGVGRACLDERSE